MFGGTLGGRSIFMITFHKQNCWCANACRSMMALLRTVPDPRLLHHAAKLNSFKQDIGSFKTTHDALPPVPNFHPWSLCCRRNEQNEKEANRKNEEKYGDDEGWVFHDTNGLLISRAHEFAPIFCFKARYIRKKREKKNGRKTAPVTRERKEKWAKLRENRSTDHSRSSAFVIKIFGIKK